MLTRQQQAMTDHLKRIKADRAYVTPETPRELWAAQRALTPTEDGKWSGTVEDLTSYYQMQDQASLLTVAEYFAGIGLVRMGLEPFGWRVVFANDISEKKYEMYKAFFPDANGHYTVGDIFKVDPRQVPKTTLATCSFPCIDLSLAGNMNGIGGKHSSAFWGFIRILKSQGDSAPHDQRHKDVYDICRARD
jgi:hypothetical protein